MRNMNMYVNKQSLINNEVRNEHNVISLPDYKSQRKFIGNILERVSITDNLDLVCDEEFLLKGSSRPSLVLHYNNGEISSVIHGNWFIARNKENEHGEQEWVGLEKYEIEYLAHVFGRETVRLELDRDYLKEAISYFIEEYDLTKYFESSTHAIYHDLGSAYIVEKETGTMSVKDLSDKDLLYEYAELIKNATPPIWFENLEFKEMIDEEIEISLKEEFETSFLADPEKKIMEKLKNIVDPHYPDITITWDKQKNLVNLFDVYGSDEDNGMWRSVEDFLKHHNLFIMEVFEYSISELEEKPIHANQHYSLSDLNRFGKENWNTVHVVIKANVFHEENLPIKSRTFITNSKEKLFDSNMGGISLHGVSIDEEYWGERQKFQRLNHQAIEYFYFANEDLERIKKPSQLGKLKDLEAKVEKDVGDVPLEKDIER